jgi:hypothetical protein
MSNHPIGEDRFVDGIGTVAVQSSIVRLELLRAESLSSEPEQQKLVVSERLVMSLDTLLRVYQALTAAVQQLEERGIIKRQIDNGQMEKTKQGKNA